jgi:hypothetical protein
MVKVISTGTTGFVDYYPKIIIMSMKLLDRFYFHNVIKDFDQQMPYLPRFPGPGPLAPGNARKSRS